MENVARQDLWVPGDSRAFRVFRAHQAPLARRASRDRQEPQAPRVRPESEETGAFQESGVERDCPVLRAYAARPDPRDTTGPGDFPEKKAPRDMQVLRVLLASLDVGETQASQAPRVTGANRAHPGRRARRDERGTKVRRDRSARLDPTESQERRASREVPEPSVPLACKDCRETVGRSGNLDHRDFLVQRVLQAHQEPRAQREHRGLKASKGMQGPKEAQGRLVRRACKDFPAPRDHAVKLARRATRAS